MKAQLQFQFDQFPQHLTDILLNLFSSKGLCDVRLIGEDDIPVEAHKVILAAFSRVMKQLIKEENDPVMDIKVQGMKYNDIEKIIQFMYIGKVSIAHGGVDKFLRTAKFLGLIQLSDQCKASLEELNREFSIIKVLSDASESYKETTLEETVDQSSEINLSDADTNEEYEDMEECGIRVYEDYGEVNDENDIMMGNKKETITNSIVNNFDQEEREKEVNEEDNTLNFTIGEPEPGFNIFSSVLFSHHYFQKVDNNHRALCLVCMKTEGCRKTFRIAYENRGISYKGLIAHLKAKHLEYFFQFKEQNKHIKELRVKSREKFNEDMDELGIQINEDFEEAKVEKDEEPMNVQNSIQLIKPESAEEGREKELNEKDNKFKFTIGEPEPGFNIFNSVLISHHYFQKVNKNQALCLVCMQTEGCRKVLRIAYRNIPHYKSLSIHLLNKHPELFDQFKSQKKHIDELRINHRKAKKGIVHRKYKTSKVTAFAIFNEADYADVTIGQKAPDFKVNSSVFFSCNFFRRVRTEDGSLKSFCLMCWKKEKRKSFFSTERNSVVLRSHLASKHAEFVDEYVKQSEKVKKMKSVKKQFQEEQSRMILEFKREKKEMERKNNDKKLNEVDLFDSGLFVNLENGSTVRIGEASDPDPNNPQPQDTLYKFNYFEKVIDENNEQASRCLICAALMEKGIEPRDSKKGILKRVGKRTQHIKLVHPSIYTNHISLIMNTTQDDYDDIDVESILEEEFTIGELSPKFDINKSVYFSHNFYRKSDKGSKVLCLMCLKSTEKKKVLLKVSSTSTKGMLCHMQAYHNEYATKYSLQSKIIQAMRIEKRICKLKARKMITERIKLQ